MNTKTKLEIADMVIEIRKREKTHEALSNQLKEMGPIFQSLLDYFPKSTSPLDGAKFRSLFDDKNKEKLESLKTLLSKLPAGNELILMIDKLKSKKGELAVLHGQLDYTLSPKDFDSSK